MKAIKSLWQMFSIVLAFCSIVMAVYVSHVSPGDYAKGTYYLCLAILLGIPAGITIKVVKTPEERP